MLSQAGEPRILVQIGRTLTRAPYYVLAASHQQQHPPIFQISKTRKENNQGCSKHPSLKNKFLTTKMLYSLKLY